MHGTKVLSSVLAILARKQKSCAVLKHVRLMRFSVEYLKLLEI